MYLSSEYGVINESHACPKGFLDKILKKLPGQQKKADVYPPLATTVGRKPSSDLRWMQIIFLLMRYQSHGRIPIEMESGNHA